MMCGIAGTTGPVFSRTRSSRSTSNPAPRSRHWCRARSGSRRIKKPFELDDATYRKVSALVFSEGWFFNGGGGDADGDWYRFIRAEILHLRDVMEIRGYLDAMVRYRFGPPEVAVAHEPAAPTAVLKRSRRWLAKRDVTLFDLLLITVVGGIIVGIAIWLLTG